MFQDRRLDGWPWTPGTANWVEPTAHALRALRLSLPHHEAAAARERIAIGERLLLDRRCRDGGWNYGNKRVLQEDLPSYSECTALALIGLSGNGQLDLAASRHRAQEDWAAPQAALARGLMRIGLRMQGIPFADNRPELHERTETTQIALALIGEAEGTWRLWRGESQ